VERLPAEGTVHVSEDAFICEMIERVSKGEAYHRVDTQRIHPCELPAPTAHTGVPASRCLLCIGALDEQIADSGSGEQVAGT
jgi:hypothetical protein